MTDSKRRKLGLFLKKYASNGKFRRRFAHRAWNTYEHIIFEYHTRRNIWESDTVAPLYPKRLYWIDPESVTHYMSRRFDLLRDTGKIKGGDWDRELKRSIESSGMYQRFLNHFQNGVPWEETKKYQKRVERIKNNNSYRYPTIQALDRKYALYDDLYEKFSAGDYLTQKELASQHSPKTIGDGGNTFFPQIFNSSIVRHEVTINVSRNGELLPADGRHRFMIARIAGVDKIPVRIVVRHKEWQNIRDDIKSRIQEAQSKNKPDGDLECLLSNTGMNSVESSHPDIKNIF